MSNPNTANDNAVYKGIENLFEALQNKGVILKAIEISKPLNLMGKPISDLEITYGAGYNHRHIKVKTP